MTIRLCLLLVLASAGAGDARACDPAPVAGAERTGELRLAGAVARALAGGAEAEGRGTEGAAALLEAGRYLQATGARPAEPSLPDLGRVWWNEGIARGAEAPPPVRGRPLGPAYRRARIGPGGEATLEQLFLAGQRAEIALMPSRPSPLVLEVSDSDGRTICRRRAEDPPAQCSWLPVFTTRHSIVIKNEGRASADYFLVVN
jgi:hypothetical protein